MAITDPRIKAVADQLRAEIAGSQWKTAAAFARALNDAGTKVEYTGFTEKVAGKSEISMRLLLPALDLLGIDYSTFIEAAMRRVPRSEG